MFFDSILPFSALPVPLLRQVFLGVFVCLFLVVFFVLFSGCPGTLFLGFRVPLGVSRRVSGTSFLEEFQEFPDFGGGSKSMAGAMF